MEDSRLKLRYPKEAQGIGVQVPCAPEPTWGDIVRCRNQNNWEDYPVTEMLLAREALMKPARKDEGMKGCPQLV